MSDKIKDALLICASLLAWGIGILAVVLGGFFYIYPGTFEEKFQAHPVMLVTRIFGAVFIVCGVGSCVYGYFLKRKNKIFAAMGLVFSVALLVKTIIAAMRHFVIGHLYATFIACVMIIAILVNWDRFGKKQLSGNQR